MIVRDAETLDSSNPFKVIPDETMVAISACNFPIKNIERVISKGKAAECFGYRGLLVNWDTLDMAEKGNVHLHIKGCDACQSWAKKHKVDWVAVTKEVST